MKRGRVQFYAPDACYFVTTTVTGFAKIFSEPALMEILVNNIRFYQEKFAVKIHAYVLMPNHFHLLLTTRARGDISKFMGQLKEFSAKQVLAWCRKNARHEYLQIFLDSAVKHKTHHVAQVWQTRFDDVVIDNADTFFQKMEYIHSNPLQEHWQLASFSEEYPFSSARFYFDGEAGVIPVSHFADN